MIADIALRKRDYDDEELRADRRARTAAKLAGARFAVLEWGDRRFDFAVALHRAADNRGVRAEPPLPQRPDDH